MAPRKSIDDRLDRLERIVAEAAAEPEASPAGRRVLRSFDQVDAKLGRIEQHLERQDGRLDRLEFRIALLFAGLGVLVTILNVALPLLLKAWRIT